MSNLNEYIKKIGSKNLIIIGIVIIVVITCIVGGSLLYYNFFYKKSFSEIEDIMVSSAKSYYSKNKSELPGEIGSNTEIDVSTLVSREYMKSIADYVKNEDVACKAKVNVTNVNNSYRYVPILDCGKYYATETMVSHIKDNEEVVSEKEGLYSINEDLVFRGEKINNYVSFAGHSWRIIKISGDKLFLIFNDKLDKQAWDDRYNTERKSNVGINDYSVSRIRDYMNSLYSGNTLFSDSDKLLLSNFNLNIGKVSENDDGKNIELERSNIIENQFIGLITIRDYMNASLDSNCTATTNPSCINYNFIVDYDYNFYSMTGDKDTSYNVYQIDNSTGAYMTKASASSYIRPVVSIVKDAIYVSGDGTSKNPYKFK